MVELTYIVLTQEHGKGKVLVLANNIVHVETSPSSSAITFINRLTLYVEECPIEIYSRIANSTAKIKNG